MIHECRLSPISYCFKSPEVLTNSRYRLLLEESLSGSLRLDGLSAERPRTLPCHPQRMLKPTGMLLHAPTSVSSILGGSLSKMLPLLLPTPASVSSDLP
jgi:hypothetical protein